MTPIHCINIKLSSSLSGLEKYNVSPHWLSSSSSAHPSLVPHHVPCVHTRSRRIITHTGTQFLCADMAEANLADWTGPDRTGLDRTGHFTTPQQLLDWTGHFTTLQQPPDWTGYFTTPQQLQQLRKIHV